MRILTDFNDDWLFEGRDRVRLPHNAVELPFSYFDERAYQRPFTYSKAFLADPAWENREVTLRFDGAMANTVVRLNGEIVATHADGYTPFVARLTGRLVPGTNHLSVTIDGTENPAIPPFGNVIDYLTYAGLYREVWLQVTTPTHIQNVKIETPDIVRPRAEIRVMVSKPEGRLTAVIRDKAGVEVARAEAPAALDTALTLETPGVALWSPENPALYTLDVTLTTDQGRDDLQTRFGFRKVVFSPEGFFLNGQRIKLRGLNRHQSFPYIGYALGRAAQVKDAEIIKHELRCNMVRTSHYPQSTYFLEACDELGLMVFEEIPGWQHIGDKAWQKASVENVRAMITRDWNHPSIVIWGVRINESGDNHDFYKETNAVARSLDRTRPTGGVRYITDSEFLEDVYTMNDFILGNEELGGNRPRTPLRPQQEVTGLDRPVPYMITEFGGHMYPTKSTDQEQRQAEHVIRHLDVLNAMYGDPQIAGAIGWCAFDYNTHKDFGSGDRICHHGVMDMFREPKFAAYAYASQSDPSEGPILQPVTFWARGERNIGGILPLLILTNCDEVELRYGNHPPKRVKPDHDRFPHLPHPPVIVDNRVFTKDELGLWGMKWEAGTVTGFINGKQVAQTHFAADPVATRLEVAPDATTIGAHDSLRVMVRALDQTGHKLPFFPEPVSITVTGPARRVGPGFVPLRAGSTGFWLQAHGAGEITITVSNDRLGTVVTQIISE
ncbi:glycoside hydrolase family 2 protein [Rhodobacter sp. KR11]|uniref:glycoside hydrolase family 2 protein n=1 Tax=Rhodobacter sp. KR11 TaxID=2974588 RepID=UPI0022223D7C|nr:glycoside hydrolase family 2 TIM barrel-domain containing protein [Rhodobacter sp. KR11]MCW1917564.1 glycoside hydrolase family 2 protein [Rhodobacter sp. KR11]